VPFGQRYAATVDEDWATMASPFEASSDSKTYAAHRPTQEVVFEADLMSLILIRSW
jgi:hypothetical protein